MARSSALRIRIALGFLLIFGLLVFTSVYVVIRVFESSLSSNRKSLALTALNLARLYADIRHPGPWEARDGILYKGGVRMSGSEEVSRGLRDYVPSDIDFEFGAGVPDVELTRSSLPWWERLLSPPPRDGMQPMQPPPSDAFTFADKGAFLGLRGADGAVVGWIYVSQQEDRRGGPQNSLYVFIIGAGAVVSVIIIIGLSILVFRLSKPIDTIVEAHGRMVRRNVELSRTARTDPLTGLLNRRGFQEMLGEERRSLPEGAFIAMLDIDHFKQVNDTRGHECGDAVLVEFARVLAGGVRQQDFCVRWGGEEFLAMLVGVDAEIAARSVERLRKAVETHRFEHAGQAVPVTVTIGLTRLSSAAELAEAVDRADKALYQGKQAGRNRVVMYAP